MLRLENRIALITGSDSGMGQAMAEEFAREGAHVVVNYFEDETGANETLRQVQAAGRRGLVVQADVRDPRAVERLFGSAQDVLGTPDVLVNNAGVGSGGKPLHEVSDEEWDRVIRTDLYGPFHCCREFIRRRKAAGGRGRIVNVTSVHEHVPLEGAGPYVAAKHGLGGFTKVAALELAQHGITVNAVAPGEIATPMTGNEDVDPKTVERPGIPAGRPGSAHEIAAAIAFLASDEASYVTGESFVIDGGMLLMAAMANQFAID
jgi:glucose 1-dehydrogenase